jgi:hypothetical protein
MNSSAYGDVLDNLIGLALDCQKKVSYNAIKYEPAFFAVLMYIKGANLNLQAEAEDKLISLLQPLNSQSRFNAEAFALVAYCMRDLKSLKVKEALLKLFDQIPNHPRWLTPRRQLELMLQAYESEWDDDKTYYYFKRDDSRRY